MEVIVEKFNPWKDTLVMGVLMLLVGILLAVFQSESLKWILIITGVLILASGALSLWEAIKSKFKTGWVMAVVYIVLGLALILLPSFFQDLLMALLAIALIIMGVVNVLQISPGVAVAKGSKLLSVLVGAVLLILGVYALLNLDDAADVVMIIIGVVLAVMGLLRILGSYNLKKVFDRRRG